MSRIGRSLASFALLVAVLPALPARAQALGGPPGGAGNDAGNDAVTGLQGALLANPSSRDQVMSLQDDPQMQAILNDPALMRAVQSGDLGALMNDPRIQALESNPTVRGLVEQQGH